MTEPNPDSYNIIGNQSSALFKDRNSKFLALTFPVTSQEQVESRIAQLKKEYHDATHHCYAYVLGARKDIFKAHDDGEPGHSAGDPILGQIRSRDLSDTLVVVIRYFGGTKLGVGGLIQAYRTAASMALDDNKLLKRKVNEVLQVTFEYPQMNFVMRIIKLHHLKIFKQSFDETCSMDLGVAPSLMEGVIEKLKEGQIAITGRSGG